MKLFCRRKNKSQLGASMIEYTLLVSLIALVSLVSMRAVGESAKAKMKDVAVELGADGNFACIPGNPGYPACLNP